MPLILLCTLSPLIVAFGTWHVKGYFNGRYLRWSEEMIANRQS